jgi:hypothetical protein
MAHLFTKPVHTPEFATHHEIHLREEEAMALTRELIELLGFRTNDDLPYLTGRFPTLTKIMDLLGDRNSRGPKREVEPITLYSYPTKRQREEAQDRKAFFKETSY